MEALAVPGVLLVWAALCVWASDRSGGLVPPGAGRSLFSGALFLALLPLPLLDELLAQPQFAALCREAALVAVYQQPLRGRTVQAQPPVWQTHTGLAVPVQIRHTYYLDALSREPLAGHAAMQAAGGKLARVFAPNAPPLTFEGVCAPADPATQLALLGLQIAKPPAAVEAAP